MSQKPLKVGIIGTGIFARRHYKAYESVGKDKFEVVACANRSKDKALDFAKEAGIPESAVYTEVSDLINDPNVEVVDILLPAQFNKETVEAVVAANKHVMFEKPIAATLKDAREIVNLSQKAKTVVAVNENWAYHPLACAVAEYVQKGGIGEWRQNPEHPGGYLSDGCVHDMAHLIPILGYFDTVAAFATKRHKIHVVEDTLATTIKLENGGVGVANFTFCSAGVKRQTLVVHGTKGTVKLTDHQEVKFINEEGEEVDPSPITSLQSNAPGNGLSDIEAELATFHDAVRSNKKLGLTAEDAFHHLAFIVASLESVKTGKAIKVERA